MSSISRGKWLALLCLVPFTLFFIVFEIAPLVWVLINSLQTEETGWGLDNFTRIFSSKFYLQAIQFSLEISFYSSIFGIIISVLGSYSSCWGSTAASPSCSSRPGSFRTSTCTPRPA